MRGGREWWSVLVDVLRHEPCPLALVGVPQFRHDVLRRPLLDERTVEVPDGQVLGELGIDLGDRRDVGQLFYPFYSDRKSVV